MPERKPERPSGDDRIALFLCGDVMTGRGIDQIMPRSAQPRLYEPYVTDARQYVLLAEAVNGRIPQPVDPAYVWGEALAELDHANPDARIINLETAVTADGEPWPGKGIHYRMHPANVDILQTAKIDCCVLANNHVLDWGYAGLKNTLQTLDAAEIGHAGAGRGKSAAESPTTIPANAGGRILVFAFASETSGVPPSWAADRGLAGVNLIDDYSSRTVDAITSHIGRHKGNGDVVVASIHWGENWGYTVPAQQQAFAHALIDSEAVDVVHGHSSHHIKGIEIYREKPIFYGCGDFINDYEGIRGQEEYRGDLSLMYFPTLSAGDGKLFELKMTPMQIEKFQLHRATAEDARWLLHTLNREGEQFGTRAEIDRDGRFELHWDEL